MTLGEDAVAAGVVIAGEAVVAIGAIAPDVVGAARPDAIVPGVAVEHAELISRGKEKC